MEAGLRIRVDDALRRDFIAVCKAKDTTAAQVLRAHMRSYVKEHGSLLDQHDLFDFREDLDPVAQSHISKART